MTQDSEITQFDALAPQLTQHLEEISRHTELSRRAYKRVWDNFDIAVKAYSDACLLRERMLLFQLNVKGLAVCSGIHQNRDNSHLDNPTPEKLGIYLRSQMKLYYIERGPFDIRGEYDDSIGYITMLRLLCPEHFPRQRTWSFCKGPRYTSIESEVELQDGRYILTVNGYDISDIANCGRLDVEPNGKCPSLLGNVVYRMFGIPDLPKRPELDDVKYGR